MKDKNKIQLPLPYVRGTMIACIGGSPVNNYKLRSAIKVVTIPFIVAYLNAKKGLPVIHEVEGWVSADVIRIAGENDYSEWEVLGRLYRSLRVLASESDRVVQVDISARTDTESKNFWIPVSHANIVTKKVICGENPESEVSQYEVIKSSGDWFKGVAN